MSGVITATNLQTSNIKSATGNASITVADNGNTTIGGTATFSNPPTGAGSMIKLLDTTSVSGATYDISSTYINATYDDYFCIFKLMPATDNVNLACRVAVGGTYQTGNIYGYEVAGMSSSTYDNNNGTSAGYFNVTSFGSASGEGINGHFYMHNVNTTSFPFTLMGQSTQYNTSSVPNANHFSTHLLAANASNVVNGFQFFMSSGNIASGAIKLYGVK